MNIEYSSQSSTNAIEIIAYLKRNFSQKEIDKFYYLLAEFEGHVGLFPTLYPENKKLKIRKAVLSKVLSVYYTIRKNKIFVVAILDSRWDEARKINP